VKVSRFRKVALRWDPERGRGSRRRFSNFTAGYCELLIYSIGTLGLNKWETNIFSQSYLRCINPK